MGSNNALAAQTPTPAPAEPAGKPPIAELEQVSLRFRDGTRALDQVSLTINQGECLGLLGPNGAGKTTILRLLAGVLLPDSGQIRLFWQACSATSLQLRQRIGYLSQRGGVDPYLSGRDNITLLGRLHGLRGSALARRTDHLLALVGLDQDAHRRASSYSGGMQRRLALACSLVHQPDLLLLDEPTAGLDARGKAAFWDDVLRMQQQGLTIVLASHDTQELERFCQRVVLLHLGRTLAEGTPAALTAQIRGDLLTLDFAEASAPAQASGILQGLACVARVLPHEEEGALTLEVEDGPAALTQIAWRLAEAPLRARRMTINRPTLEDVFFRITGASLAQTQWTRRESGTHE